MVKAMSSVIHFCFFCFVFDELSTINYPSKRHNLNPISKLKKEQKKKLFFF